MATQEDRRRYDAAKRKIADRKRRKGQRLTRQEARELCEAAEVVFAFEDGKPLPAARPVKVDKPLPAVRTAKVGGQPAHMPPIPPVLPPKERLAKLRRDFGDERRDASVWDSLPEPLQEHWLYTLRDAGETLTASQEHELRSLEQNTGVSYGTLRPSRRCGSN